MILAVALAGCSLSQTIQTISAGTAIAVNIELLLKPPASDLADFSASKAAADFTLSNTKLENTTGTVTITISDENTGTQLGQASFGYAVNGSDVASFNYPNAVTNWVRSFSSYNGYVTVQVAAKVKTSKPSAGTTAKITSASMYDNTKYSSATATYTTPSGGGRTCTTCRQFGPTNGGS